MKILLILVLCVVSPFYPIYGWAACLNWSGNTATVDSPYSAALVQDCIEAAKSKIGEVTIQIPDSTVTWASGVTVNMRSGWGNVTGLTIRGQNDCTLDGNGRPTACGTNITGATFAYTGEEGKAFRIAHMRMTGSSAGTQTVINIVGNGKSWRFDHIFFDTITGAVIFRIGRTAFGHVTYGLIDHNNVQNNQYMFLHYNANADGGNLEWMSPLGLGTADAFYLEDNTFYMTAFSATASVVDCNGPGKFVVRYNDIHNNYLNAHDAIVTGSRGVRKWEVYNNNFTYDINGNCFVMDSRSGTGVVFNNTISDPYGVLCRGYIQFIVYRTVTHGGEPWYPYCSNTSGKAILDTSTNYPQTCTSGTGCINIDGSSSSPSGYPCRDQLGVDGNNPQTSRPFLLWNNTKNGGPITVGIGGGSENYIVSGRDYCLSNTTMPVSCNGVTTIYEPYTYPHPLRQAGGDTSPLVPSAPRSLRIVN